MVSHPPASSAQPTLATPRLLLRAFLPTDAAAVTREVSDPRVAHQTLLPHPYPVGAAEAFIGRCAMEWEAGKAATWAITRRDDMSLIGAIAVRMVRAHRTGDLGYWLAVPAWGQGFMTEAIDAVATAAFAGLGLHRLEARLFPDNPASARVLEKCGFRQEGTLRGALWKENAPRDVRLYARLVTDAR
ncbi:MAG: GNAT family N-acetyltransferase [Gemmatimonadota bacterium]